MIFQAQSEVVLLALSPPSVAKARSSMRASCLDIRALFILYLPCISDNARSACLSVSTSTNAMVEFLEQDTVTP